jgi:uncharacterized protein (TIGR02757 family)
MIMNQDLEKILNENYTRYSISEFIAFDPISIPKKYTSLQDIEIAGFFAAIFSWGRRDIIINKSNELMALMGHSPYRFVKNYSIKDYKKIAYFKHRTFNGYDLDFYIRAMQRHYEQFESLEAAFCFNAEDLKVSQRSKFESQSIEDNLKSFYTYFSSLVPNETRNLKHISTPAKNSACKRLCMYLRWMVRDDKVDFGLWKNINPSQLIIPLDVHVMKIAVRLDLISKNDKPNWKTALKLTKAVREFDLNDPVKYDFALFGISAL